MNSYGKPKGKEPLKINLTPPDTLFLGGHDVVCSQAGFAKSTLAASYFF